MHINNINGYSSSLTPILTPFKYVFHVALRTLSDYQPPALRNPTLQSLCLSLAYKFMNFSCPRMWLTLNCKLPRRMRLFIPEPTIRREHITQVVNKINQINIQTYRWVNLDHNLFWWPPCFYTIIKYSLQQLKQEKNNEEGKIVEKCLHVSISHFSSLYMMNQQLTVL